MHITEKDAIENRPAQPERPLQRSVEAQFESLRRLVVEFENWMTIHENDASRRRRFELEGRLSTTRTLFQPYLNLLINAEDERYVDLTTEFRDRYYDVIARALVVLESDPQHRAQNA